MKIIKIIFIFLLVSPFIVHSDNYDVDVTRKDRNLYKVDGEDILINTRYCYEYAYSEEAYLRMDGYKGEIFFLDSGEKYDVDAVYGRIDQKAGKYTVTISRKDDNWYEIWGKDIFIKTNGCLSLALMEEVILSIEYGGFGTLYVDGYQCNVEGLYSRLKL